MKESISTGMKRKNPRERKLVVCQSVRVINRGSPPNHYMASDLNRPQNWGKSKGKYEIIRHSKNRGQGSVLSFRGFCPWSTLWPSSSWPCFVVVFVVAEFLTVCLTFERFTMGGLTAEHPMHCKVFPTG